MGLKAKFKLYKYLRRSHHALVDPLDRKEDDDSGFRDEMLPSTAPNLLQETENRKQKTNEFIPSVAEVFVGLHEPVR